MSHSDEAIKEKDLRRSLLLKVSPFIPFYSTITAPSRFKSSMVYSNEI